jgi:transcriptional regulator with XRE-family HTH domain
MVNHFLQQVKYLRNKRDLSQAFIAEIMGMEPSTYGKKENGTSAFTLEEAIKLCEYYSIDLCEAVYGNQKSNIVTDAATIYNTTAVPKIAIQLMVSIPDLERMGFAEMVKQQMGFK